MSFPKHSTKIEKLRNFHGMSVENPHIQEAVAN